MTSLEVNGPTVLGAAALQLSQGLGLSANLFFSGESSLSCTSVTARVSGARLFVVEAESTDGVLPGRLVLPEGFVLGSDLEVVTVGIGAATVLEVNDHVDLDGHALKVLGGKQGVLRLTDGLNVPGFSVLGTGRIVFEWSEAATENPDLDWSELYQRVDVNALEVPSGVQWVDAGSSGAVEVFSTSFTNRGAVRVEENGVLKIHNYTRVGSAEETTGGNATLEKL
jgi:hypothetical protein